MPLRVLLISSTAAIGGAEQMVLQLLEHADPSHVAYEVAALGDEGPLLEAVRVRGVPAVATGVRRLASPWNVARMVRMFKARRPDVIQVSGLRAELLARPAARLLGIPYISWVHSVDPWRRAHHVLLDRTTAGAVSRWVSVCEAARTVRISRERVPADRIQVVYNGIANEPAPTAEEKRSARATLQLAPEMPVVAAVGNLREAKGYPDLIEALARLDAEGRRVVCLCAGRDDSQGRIPALAQARGVAHLIRFLGFVNDPRPLLAAADGVVISSHWEGCPINLIEAMRAGKPTVATSVGGIPEMIENGVSGLLVPPREPEALAAGIMHLINDPAAADAWGKAARERFERQFNAVAMTASMTMIYQELTRP